MFGKVKRWLGIEGVKVEVFIPETVKASSGNIDGTIRFYSMHDQLVQTITIKLIERYKRGRRSGKLVDEYTLGEITLEQDIEVPAHEHIEVDFSLPFQMALSDFDRLESRNFLMKGIARTAKFARGARSEFRVEAEAEVKGTALNPFDSQTLAIIL